MYVRLIKDPVLFAAVQWVGAVLKHRSILTKSLFNILFSPKLLCSMMVCIDLDLDLLMMIMASMCRLRHPSSSLQCTTTLQADEKIQIHRSCARTSLNMQSSMSKVNLTLRATNYALQSCVTSHEFTMYRISKDMKSYSQAR